MLSRHALNHALTKTDPRAPEELDIEKNVFKTTTDTATLSIEKIQEILN